ncbi:NAD(P)H-dependent oxidoreductase [Luteimonas sp. SX5]|uniref:NAD(P)H-dependent oxidoreductase n=1 Tax=Luteimonas galliterrae TaxID=2940486 RepID=A0ABT0MJ48_9GAMM|nr:NAD(P)H-dependent oxidoreductase [Luteimonas galliterrae]MCL1634279.1 NAD(P)H-dependent oxidoreductase [Luteimonas galliterrae]
MIKIALIVGSTRPQRFADVPARWIAQGAAARPDLRLETLDLRDYALPFYREPMSPLASNGVYTDAAAEAWRRKIGEFDGYIATVAEYNHGPTAVLKNALDSAFYEWNRKPIAFVGYGGAGGVRAIEHLRGVAVELQMAPIKAEVNIGMEPFIGMLMQGKAPDDYEHLAKARETMFDQLAWWGNALKAARESLAEAA